MKNFTRHGLIALLVFGASACNSAGTSVSATSDDSDTGQQVKLDDAAGGTTNDAVADAAVDSGPDVQGVGVDAAPDPGGDSSSAVDAATDATATVAGLGPYALDGLETYHTGFADLSNAGSSFTEHLYVPESTQPHAVVVLSSATQQTATAYVTYCQRLASHGFLVLARDDPGPLVNTKVVVADLVYLVLQWLPAQNADPKSDLYGRVDLTRVGLTGHSRGGKASLLAAEGGLQGHVKAWFGIDMVDVTFIDDGIYAVTTVATVGIPTTFLAASVSTNCSPAAYSGKAVFQSASAPSVLLVAEGASHTDFEDPAGCLLCSVCTPAGTADQTVVEDYARRYVTAFFARELLGDASVGATFQGAGAAQDVAAGRIQVQTK